MIWGSRNLRLLAMLAATTMTMTTLAACGSDRDEGESSGGSGEDTEAGSDGNSGDSGDPKVVKIGFVGPLSGSLAELGLGMRNAAELAIDQANEDGKIPGWKIEFVPVDDEGDSDVGGRVAAKLASDKGVVAVVGPLNSSVGEAIQDDFDKAGIVMISPANTNPTLTQGADPANKSRPFPTYFRVATTDAVQGPFAADFAGTDVGAKTVAIIHDKKTYGQGLANAFKARFEENGGKVAVVETVEPEQTDFAAVLSKIKPLKPDLIYYGGEYPAASLISSQANQQGIDAPLMGGDGIYASTFIDVAKESGEGDFATSVGAPAESLDSAKDFIAAYDEAGYPDEFSAYGPYSYDAATVLVEALAEVLDGADVINKKVRDELVKAVQATSLEGVTGPVAFDEFGDTKSKVLTVYKVEGGAWKPKKTGEFK